MDCGCWWVAGWYLTINSLERSKDNNTTYNNKEIPSVSFLYMAALYSLNPQGTAVPQYQRVNRYNNSRIENVKVIEASVKRMFPGQ